MWRGKCLIFEFQIRIYYGIVCVLTALLDWLGLLGIVGGILLFLVFSTTLLNVILYICDNFDEVVGILGYTLDV